MNSIRDGLLHLLRQRFLQCLGHYGVTSCVGHFPGVFVGVCVVDGVGEFVFEV